MNQESDKLRIRQNSARFSVPDGVNYEPVQLQSCRNGNICYNSSEFCPEMLSFPSNSQGLLGQNDAITCQELDRHVVEASFGNFSAAISCDQQSLSAWKNQTNGDWTANQSPFIGESSSGSLKMINAGYQVPHASLINSSADIPSYNGRKPFVNLQCSTSYYQGALQEVVSPVNSRPDGRKFAPLGQNNDGETSQGVWAVGGSELLLLPGYADQLSLKSGANWYGEVDCGENNNSDGDHLSKNSSSQVLSLSLSSVPPPKVHLNQMVERDISANFHSRNVSDIPNSEVLNSAYLSSNQKFSFDSKVSDSYPQHTVGSSIVTYRTPGPLGPFTGYATILKSSRFLKPAQQLMDEICKGSGSKHIEMHKAFTDKTLEKVGASGDDTTGPIVKGIRGDSGISSFIFHSSNEKSQEPGGIGGSIDSHRPEYLQKKAKLLYMKDEVCRKYRQYRQHMQMVVSSFESVAALSAATPYISLGLKMVSRHFRCLKNAIADQLRGISIALGEDFSSLTAGTTSSGKGDTSGSRFKFMDRSFQKQKGGFYTGIPEPQHVWRPQRGLPERAVTVLRSWLFDHFLHPYPTDTDKHMLATQTGLTRNQVSNWFINARVRLWKPMVEEIHMLEANAMTETQSNATKSDGKPPTEVSDQSNRSQSLNNQTDCSRISTSECQVDNANADLWNQEKRSRVEYHIPSSMDGSYMGFVPYNRSRLEMGGLGAVSLTLGLRQSAESAQQQQPEHSLRQHIGGQIIHDFVG